MKKIAFLMVLVAVLGVAAFGVFGQVSAQAPTPQAGQGFGPGRGAGRGGMMGAGYGVMHEYLEAAFAEKLGLTVEEVEAQFEAGSRLYDIALANGYSEEEIPALMLDVKGTALAAMVADGVLTQEQADWMLQRMQTMQQTGGCQGTGPRGGRMGGGFGSGMMGAGRGGMMGNW